MTIGRSLAYKSSDFNKAVSIISLSLLYRSKENQPILEASGAGVSMGLALDSQFVPANMLLTNSTAAFLPSKL
jgi:hypothetical protein